MSKPLKCFDGVYKAINYIFVPKCDFVAFDRIFQDRDLCRPQILVKDRAEINAGAAAQPGFDLLCGHGLMPKPGIEPAQHAQPDLVVID